MTDKELWERLHEHAEWARCNEWETPLCLADDLTAAADAIERLKSELTQEKIDNTNLIGELATVAAERDRYKAERENPQPLTLEELRRMDGEIVYIPESEKFFGGTGIVSLSRKMVVDVKGLEYGVWPLSRYGAGWLAYRSKSKRSE